MQTKKSSFKLTLKEEKKMKKAIKMTVLMTLLMVLLGTTLNAHGVIKEVVEGHIICLCGSIHPGTWVSVVEISGNGNDSRSWPGRTNSDGYYKINYEVAYGYRYYIRITGLPDKLITNRVHNFTTRPFPNCAFKADQNITTEIIR